MGTNRARGGWRALIALMAATVVAATSATVAGAGNLEWPGTDETDAPVVCPGGGGIIAGPAVNGGDWVTVEVPLPEDQDLHIRVVSWSERGSHILWWEGTDLANDQRIDGPGNDLVTSQWHDNDIQVYETKLIEHDSLDAPAGDRSVLLRFDEFGDSGKVWFEITFFLDDSPACPFPDEDLLNGGLGPNHPGGEGGDPVNAATGNFYDHQVDFAGTGGEPRFTRTYNSQDGGLVEGSFGPGWASDVDAVLLDDVNGDLWFREGDGRRIRIPAVGGVHTPPASMDGAVVETVTGGRRLSWPTGRAMTFDASGRLVRLDDGTGGGSTITWGGAEGTEVQTMTDLWSGEVLTFVDDTADRKVDRVIGPGGITRHYGYDDGHLTSVSSPYTGSTPIPGETFVVEDGRITEIHTAVGGSAPDIVRLANHYDDHGRVDEQTTAGGATFTFAYEPPDPVTGELVTTVTQVAGAITDEVTFTHDAEGRLIEAEDPDDEDGAWTWDGRRVASSTSRRGALTEVTHDADGRMVARRPPHPTTTGTTQGEETWEWCDTEPGGDGRLLAHTDLAGVRTEYAYGSAAHPDWPCVPGAEVPSQVTAAAGTALAATTTVASADDLPTVVTDADGVATRYHWDTERALLLASEVDPDGAGPNVPLVTFHGYDAAGRRIVTRTPEGNETWWTRDAAGRVTVRTGPVAVTRSCTALTDDCAFGTTPPSGPTVSASYRLDGELASLTDQLGKTWTHTTAWPVGGGRVDTETSPEGRVVVTTTDAGGRVTAVGRGRATNLPGLASTSYAYGSLGRVTKATDPDGVETWFTYDADGNVLTETTGPDPDAAAHRATYQYDLRGRSTLVQGPTGDVDAAGNPVRRETATTYDVADRVTSVTEGQGADALTTRWLYDDAGRPRWEVLDLDGDGAPSFPESTDPAQRDTADRATRTEWTAAGRRYRTTVAPPDVQTFDWVGGAPGRRHTTYGYDLAGRRTSVVDPTGTTTTEYDGDGRVARAVAPGGRWTERTYDAAGRVLTTTTPGPDGTGTAVATSTWSARGELLTSTEPHDPTAGYPDTVRTYTDDGLLRTITNPIGGARSRVTLDYNSRGVLNWRNSRANNDPSDPAAHHNVVETWTFSPADRLLTEVDGLARTTTHAYDAYGRRQSTTLPSGRVETVTWWNSGPLRTSTWTQAGQPMVATEAHHDSRGRRQRVTGPGGPLTTTWDRAGNPLTITSPAAGGGTDTITNVWELMGQRRQVTLPDGREVQYKHDDADRLFRVLLNTGTPSAPVWTRRAEHTYDVAGHLTLTDVSGPAGTETWTYPSLLASRPDSHAVDVGATTRTTDLTWRLDGRLASTDVAGVGPSTYDYDAAGQLVERDGPEGLWVYTYTSRGQRQTATDPGGVTTGYTYDDAAQLVATTPSSGPSTTYGYDADGNRLTTTTGGTLVRTDAYDARGDHASAAVGAAVTTYGHDPDGRLVSGTGAVPLALTWDPTERIPELVTATLDGTSYGYLNGRERISARAASGTMSWYARDALGNVLDSPNVAAPDTYDPFGDPTDVAFTPSTFFGLRDELHTNDRVHLRHRDLDPATAAFTSVDPLGGVLGTPTVANRYHYADNDPANKVDPLGLSPEPAVDCDTLNQDDVLYQAAFGQHPGLTCDELQTQLAADAVGCFAEALFTEELFGRANRAVRRLLGHKGDGYHRDNMFCRAGQFAAFGTGLYLGGAGVAGSVDDAGRGAGAIGTFGDDAATLADDVADIGFDNVNDVMEDWDLLRGLRPEDVEPIIGDTPGWRVEGLGQGAHRGEGWVLREYTERGDPTGRMIRWHPGGGRHGRDPYWRVVTYNEKSGIIR